MSKAKSVVSRRNEVTKARYIVQRRANISLVILAAGRRHVDVPTTC
jgi:hypothetical protein